MPFDLARRLFRASVRPRRPHHGPDNLTELRMSMIPFSFRAIPADEAEPVRGGMVVMQDVPDETEIRRVVEPMLGGFTTTPVKVLDERSARCSFTSFAF